MSEHVAVLVDCAHRVEFLIRKGTSTYRFISSISLVRFVCIFVTPSKSSLSNNHVSMAAHTSATTWSQQRTTSFWNIESASDLNSMTWNLCKFKTGLD